MRRFITLLTIAIALSVAVELAQAPASGPYRVLKTVKDGRPRRFRLRVRRCRGRRIYIPRGAAQGATPIPGQSDRLRSRLALADRGDSRHQGNGAVIDSEVGSRLRQQQARGDVRHEDARADQDDRRRRARATASCSTRSTSAWIFNHPTLDATVINAKDGTVVGTVALDGVPEQSVSDGKGRIYVVIQDKANVAVVDAKALKTIAHYDFAEKASRCNGLALDAKNHVLFACGQSGPAGDAGEADDGGPRRDRRQDHHEAAAGRRAPTALCSTRRRWRRSALARQRDDDDRQGGESHRSFVVEQDLKTMSRAPEDADARHKTAMCC